MKNTLKKGISALVLACTAAALMTLGGCSAKKEYASGDFTDSPYPCAWAEQKDGSIVLTFAGELPENGTWLALTDSDAIKAEQKDGEAVFTVKPFAEGEGTLQLYLRESGISVAKGEDYKFTFSVEKQRFKLKMTYCGAEAVSVEPEGIETDSGSIYWNESAVGSLFLKADDEDWYPESCEGVITAGHSMSGTDSGIEVIAVEGASQRSIILINSETGERCMISFSYSGGVLSVAGCGAAPKEEKTVSEAEAYLAAMEAAETEEEKEALRAEYEAWEQENRFQYQLERWTEKNGREPDEKELEELRDKYLGG